MKMNKLPVLVMVIGVLMVSMTNAIQTTKSGLAGEL